jgi:eukaryotic-like serine/threonine-protein kinase
VAMQHVSADPPPPRMYNPRIPPQLESLVLRALSKEPDGRPTTARDFARQLSRYRDVGEQATVIGPAAPRPAVRPAPQPSPRPPVTGTTSPRPVLPPARSAISQAPPDNRGMGFGGFILGLLLLGGVLGLVYLALSGTFGDLFNFATGAPRPQVTIETGRPTEPPTGVPQFQVPPLTNLTSQQAFELIKSAGLTPREESPRYSDVISTGLVLDQFPQAGTTVTQTTVVTYVVSLGPNLVDVPDVQRMRAQDAQNLLTNLGFQVLVQEEASTLSEGFVTRQDLLDVKLPKGQTVTIWVSIGDKVTMPDVTGRTVDEAKQLIANAGLAFSFADVQSCDKLGNLCNQFGPGQVVSSIPRGGDRVTRGTAVTIGVRAP